MEQQSVILVYSSCNILLSIIPTFYLFGFFSSLLLFSLFITSCNYHLFNKYKKLDMILAISNWIYFFYFFKYNVSKYFLYFGFIQYIISQFVHLIKPYHFLSYFFHKNLHNFAYLSIWVEFFLHLEQNSHKNIE